MSMALRQIRFYGDEILQKKAKPVNAINAGTLALLDDMLDTLHDKEGVGLAAPQVGVLRRVVIVFFEEQLYEVINPVITGTEGTQRCNEACLSVPGQIGDIDRPQTMTVQAQDRNGETQSITVDGFLASVFSHELDHLDGILYLDKAIEIRNQEPTE